MHSLITLLLGFGLGLKYAFEADHVIAVSTTISEQKQPLQLGGHLTSRLRCPIDNPSYNKETNMLQFTRRF